MTAASPATANAAPEITAADFRKTLAFIETFTGIRLPETQYRIMKEFLAERFRSLDADVDRYLAILQNDADELNRFIDALTVKETYFFREEKHFDLLQEVIFPALARSPGPRLRFWSAACATGEEAISIRALARRFFDSRTGKAFTVFASDINKRALAIFQHGVYGPNAFRKDGEKYRALLAPWMQEAGGNRSVLRTPRRDIVVFPFNLFSDPLTRFDHAFDLIFLRNALIYMAAETRRKVLNKLTSVLSPGGFLVLSSAEVPLVSHPGLGLCERDGVFYFQKAPASARKTAREDAATARRATCRPLAHEDAPPRPEKRPADGAGVCVADVLSHANAMLNADQSGADGDVNAAAARRLLEVSRLINRTEASAAKSLLDDVTAAIPPNELTHYFQGHISKLFGDVPSALRAFSRCLELAPGFWPGRFYRAMTYPPARFEKAAAEFSVCEAHIRAYIRAGRFEYECLLDGFNAGYFLDMCRKMQRRAIAKERRHGP